ncbi:MAG: glycosyltransferase family 4 protein, partial [Mariniphaga sp.]|nr:glycosyltransferase family 4 protein [Mariniphaga sp.]
AEVQLVEVIPVWTDNTFLKPVAKLANPFVKLQGLQHKFVVLYSGNLGFTHDIEAIVDLAALIDHADIEFLIIGEGEKKALLQQKITDLQLTNCRMLPYQKPEDLPFTLAAADIAIVTLGKGASRLSVPSKTYNLMSVGAPLLCIAGQDSELASLVARYRIGRCFGADQLADMCSFVLEMVDHPEQLQELRSNSLKASLDFGVENAKRFIY